MTTAEKTHDKQESGKPAVDRTVPSEGKPKAFKLLGWRNFGLFKPSFKLGLSHKNPAYEKGYN